MAQLGPRPPWSMLAAFVLVAGCSVGSIPPSMPVPTDAPAAPADTVAPASPNTLEATADGYTLTVDVDRPTVRPGDEVTFIATFGNPTTAPIDYRMVGCDGAAVIDLHAPIPLQPVGRTWDGAAAVFKDYALTQGFGPGGVPATDPMRIDLRLDPCDGGGFEDILEPGGTITTKYTWTAEIVGGIGVLDGEIPFEVHVGYDRQNEPPHREPDATGPVGSWFPMYKDLVLEGRLTVVGDSQPVVSAGQAVDAVLQDREFAAWLVRMPASTWSNANLFLQSYPRPAGIVPAGPSWSIELFREIGVPRNWAIAFVDPIDGRLLKATYCNDPCDR